MIIKVFTKNEKGKIELTVEELEKVIMKLIGIDIMKIKKF